MTFITSKLLYDNVAIKTFTISVIELLLNDYGQNCAFGGTVVFYSLEVCHLFSHIEVFLNKILNSCVKVTTDEWFRTCRVVIVIVPLYKWCERVNVHL